MAKMGALIEKFMKNGTLIYTGGLGKSEPGGAKIRLSKGDFSVMKGPFADSVLMGASGFALMRASSREDMIEKTKEFLQVAGDGESEILQVLEMPPEGSSK